MNAHLLTGFPGFIANQLIRELFHQNITTKIYAIVLSSHFKQAQQEVSAICASYPHCQIELLEGDITLPNVGLDAKDMEKVVSNVQMLWHLAAVYDLAVSRDVAWKVNVHGTAMVNELARQLVHLQRYMYFSTAYIAGRRKGHLLETELIRPNAFKNYYEETKFEAELRVEDLKKEVPITILRPSIVCGHSQTGETLKFDGPYFLLNLIHSMSKWPIIPFVGSKKAMINVVPVDYVVQAAVFISQAAEAQGKTCHITDPHPYKVETMFHAMVKEMTGRRVYGRLPLGFTKKCLENLTLRQRLGVEYETIDYLNWPVTFDVQQAKSVLQSSTIRCPDFLEVLPKIIHFYKNNKHRRELLIAIK